MVDVRGVTGFSMGHPFVDAPGPLRSLNVARIARLPIGLTGEDLLGRRGLELVSGLRLQRDIAAHAAELGLHPVAPDAVRRFSGLLADASNDPAARRLAVNLAEGLGRRLGCLLLALVEGHPANRAMRPEWGDAQWAFWAGVRRVVVGGGLFAGSIGDLAVPAAQDVLDSHGSGRVHLSRSPWGSSIVLVGCARIGPPTGSTRTVADFGQTSIKRGVARYLGGALAGIRTLPSAPCMCASLTEAPQDRREIERQCDDMLNLIAETAEGIPAAERAADGAPIDVAASLACYMRGEQPDPIEVRSCYGRLQLVSADLRAAAADRLTKRLGGAVQVRLIDDGTAAALSVAPEEADVVITIGTAMGIGFPLPGTPLAPIADSFRIE